jgi:hypothetical protein
MDAHGSADRGKVVLSAPATIDCKINNEGWVSQENLNLCQIRGDLDARHVGEGGVVGQAKVRYPRYPHT